VIHVSHYSALWELCVPSWAYRIFLTHWACIIPLPVFGISPPRFRVFPTVILVQCKPSFRFSSLLPFKLTLTSVYSISHILYTQKLSFNSEGGARGNNSLSRPWNVVIRFSFPSPSTCILHDSAPSVPFGTSTRQYSVGIGILFVRRAAAFCLPA